MDNTSAKKGVFVFIIKNIKKLEIVLKLKRLAYFVERHAINGEMFSCDCKIFFLEYFENAFFVDIFSSLHITQCNIRPLYIELNFK